MSRKSRNGKLIAWNKQNPGKPWKTNEVTMDVPSLVPIKLKSKSPPISQVNEIKHNEDNPRDETRGQL